MIIKELDYLQKEEFLEHFGVKGQKWGVRNKRDVSPSQKAETHAKRVKTAKKVATVAAVAATVAVGAKIALKILKAKNQAGISGKGSTKTALKLMKASKTTGVDVKTLMGGVRTMQMNRIKDSVSLLGLGTLSGKSPFDGF